MIDSERGIANCIALMPCAVYNDLMVIYKKANLLGRYAEVMYK